MTNAEIRHDAAAQRYEYVVDDGEPIAILDYRRGGDTVVMHHTYTDPAHRGQGYAAQVVGYALDDARANRFTVVPACSFVAEYVETHPEYQDLVAAG